ncbi:MAG: formate hydrogenlyase [Alphaproteobacteria bacterium CG_4_10_14_0_2_um_filter_63_37]|nr:MAG: formate hydrogenlyase [Proteobacteria bacterium CG1_02_64_396]PJA25526.1 MAG: formate hydrogenlyase [Alphaproteobacteria bacterium CG_4_10_14_0_2_um_filter_63_37]
MSTWLRPLLETLLLAGLAPLATGLLRWFKAHLQNRQGPPLLQPYRDLLKLLAKQPLVPEPSSWIFRAAPYIGFAAIVVAAAIVPVLSIPSPLTALGDVIVLAALFALARFFTALAALDTGTPFGGMGASREMSIASLAEPAMLMAIFVLSLAAHSTNLSVMIDSTLNAGLVLRPSVAFALIAMVLVALAETGRLPVDNPATHLELTMIHEAMVLEYSGRYLALIEWAQQIKLLLFVTLILNLFAPWGIADAAGDWWIALVAWVLKVVALLGLLGVLETTVAKMRIFRVPEYLGAAFAIGMLGMLTHFILEVGV